MMSRRYFARSHGRCSKADRPTDRPTDRPWFFSVQISSSSSPRAYSADPLNERPSA